MKIKLSQLRKLIREVVEEEMMTKEATVDEVDEVEEASELDEYDGSYSRGGAGGNRHGDSWDEPESTGYSYESPSDREARRAREEERWAKRDREDSERSGVSSAW